MTQTLPAAPPSDGLPSTESARPQAAADTSSRSTGRPTAEPALDRLAALACATDPGVRVGALSARGCDRIAGCVDDAVRRGVPVVGLWPSGGAVLQEGAVSLDGVAGCRTFLTWNAQRAGRARLGRVTSD